MIELATIGYESAALDDFIATLSVADINLVIDVRDVANSRRKGFSKSALSAALAHAGIDYVHLRGLGTPKAGRDAARSGDRATFSRIFAEHMAGPEAMADLARAEALVRTERACLLCYERAPAACHRSIVAEMLRARLDLKVVDLFVGADAADGHSTPTA